MLLSLTFLICEMGAIMSCSKCPCKDGKRWKAPMGWSLFSMFSPLLGTLIILHTHSRDKDVLVRACMLSRFCCVQLFAIPWTVAHQAPLSMGFSRQEYWSGWQCPSPGDLPDLGMEPTSHVSPTLAGRFFTTEPPGKPQTSMITPRPKSGVFWETQNDWGYRRNDGAQRV